jgi:hypothetical protein
MDTFSQFLINLWLQSVAKIAANGHDRIVTQPVVPPVCEL